MDIRIIKIGSVILFLLLSCFSCNDENCKEFQLENYLSENSNLEDSIRTQIQDAYVKFEEPKELKTEYESYRLIYVHTLTNIYNL